MTEIPINYPSSASHLLDRVNYLVGEQRKFALLTLVHIEGSAPYPLGSQMLVDETGNFWGQITGGCAETALAEQAVSAINDNKSQSHRYGLDSPFFDIQLPCGSGIDVYFDVTTPHEKYQELLSELQGRQPGRLALTTDKGEFIRHYLPVERLIVFGQGPILLALLKLAQESGFETLAIVQDELDRASLIACGFESVLLRSAGAYEIMFDANSAVISLFHEHEREIEILKWALNSEVFYIGALGSRRTHGQRCEALQQNGVDDASMARIHGPIGLDIAAESPAQIAISILAEIVKEMPKLRPLHG